MQMTSVPYGANNGIESHFWPHGFDKQMQCKNDCRFIFKDHNTCGTEDPYGSSVKITKGH